jgi:hypothetical protein
MAEHVERLKGTSFQLRVSYESPYRTLVTEGGVEDAVIVKFRGHSECAAGKHFVYGPLCVQVLTGSYKPRSINVHIQYVLHRTSVLPLMHTLSTPKVPPLPRPTLCASVSRPINPHPRKIATNMAYKVDFASVVLCP